MGRGGEGEGVFPLHTLEWKPASAVQGCGSLTNELELLVQSAILVRGWNERVVLQ